MTTSTPSASARRMDDVSEKVPESRVAAPVQSTPWATQSRREQSLRWFVAQSEDCRLDLQMASSLKTRVYDLARTREQVGGAHRSCGPCWSFFRK